MNAERIWSESNGTARRSDEVDAFLWNTVPPVALLPPEVFYDEKEIMAKFAKWQIERSEV